MYLSTNQKYALIQPLKKHSRNCLLQRTEKRATGTEEKTQQFLQRFPRFVPIFIKIGDSLQAEKQVFMDDYKNLSPEDRYQKLLETQPDLVNRVPQYMIASYLGIQPESLSRIRKRIWANNKA